MWMGFRRARGVERSVALQTNASDCDRETTYRRLDAVVCELAEATSLEDIVTIVTHAARQLVRASGATFVLREGDQCHYVDEEAIAPLWKRKRFPMSACISGWSMLHRQQAIIPDIYADARIPHDAYRPTFVRSLVMTPVGTSEPWAAIGVYWAAECSPTPEQARSLQALANTTSVALENVRMRMRLARAGPLDSDRPAPVTMCAWTRRIKWRGTWLSVERFLEERFGLPVTHGISDEALRALDPQAPASAEQETPRQ
jgi:hypothetical protein